jgi:hypothetical protein
MLARRLRPKHKPCHPARASTTDNLKLDHYQPYALLSSPRMTCGKPECLDADGWDRTPAISHLLRLRLLGLRPGGEGRRGIG